MLGEALTSILCCDSMVTEREEQKDDDVAIGSYLYKGRKEISCSHTQLSNDLATEEKWRKNTFREMDFCPYVCVCI